MASLVLLVVLAAVFAPAAGASVIRSSHACCLHRNHDRTMFERAGTCDPAGHDCCGAVTIVVATLPVHPATTVRPAKSHPFLEEFYPSADSSDSSHDVSQRAPPASSAR